VASVSAFLSGFVAGVCAATPAMTSTTPRASGTVGIWVSTITPITVAVAGSSDTISAYVTRGSRARASWSATYGCGNG
jgi:hypothetical protein